jgi:hypothetical protein
MTSRTPSDKSDTVGLFPFLAVLLCTMGALLVLLVVLAHKARQHALATVQPSPAVQSEVVCQPSEQQDRSAQNAARLAQRLATLHRQQHGLAELGQQVESQLEDEQLRLSHLEEHTRRLEHELAALHLTAKQLEATEGQRVIDQQQAERKLISLTKLVEQTSQELEQIRDQATEKLSYAIVPYTGPNGTVRRPLYIECCKEGVIIQPEGIRLQAKDFIAPFDAGNPLAKAMRAARDHLNARAQKGGAPQAPDPYPLMIVRPDGIHQYAAARKAIESWDSAFGYELINDDWNLEYPDPDPELAQVMYHAVLQGRERLAMLIQSAPRRYGKFNIATISSQYGQGGPGGQGHADHASDNGQGDEWGSGPVGGKLADAASADASTAASSQTLDHAGPHSTADGSAHDLWPATSDRTGNHGGPKENHASTGEGPFSGEGFGTETGPIGIEGGPEGASHGQIAGQPHESTSPTSPTSQQPTLSNVAPESNSGKMPLSQATSSQAAASHSDPSAPASATALAQAAESGSHAGSNPGTGTNGSGTTSGGSGFSSASPGDSSGSSSIAQTQGSNWAVRNAGRGAVPIRRPIQVVVRGDHLAILPSRHQTEQVPLQGSVIPLGQPTDEVIDQFTAALKEHMNDWGLAGNGLYWRPVLVLNVGPDGKDHAIRLTQLLDDSGIEIREASSHRNRKGAAHALR